MRERPVISEIRTESERIIQVRCQDGCSLLQIHSFDDDELVSLSFWAPIGHKETGLRSRLRAAWQMVRHGHGYEEIMMHRDRLVELGRYLAAGFPSLPPDKERG